MPCHHFGPRPLSRRDMLRRCATGFGATALAALLGDRAFGALADLGAPAPSLSDPLAVRPPHFRPRAKNVIFLLMEGGVSAVDSFDPKPRLQAENGQPFTAKKEATQFQSDGKILGSPWEFKSHGQCGHPISSLFPHIASCADDLLIIRSLSAEFSEHATANYFLHTGTGLQGRPSMGAWTTYGLGSACRDLPGFVVLNGGRIPFGGRDNFGSAFLPASYQGSIFESGAEPMANLVSPEPNPARQRLKLDALRQLDRGLTARHGHHDPVEAAIANYELAFRMQTAVPDLMNLAGESASTKQLYGLDASHPAKRIYASMCLTARRLVERGVRFIEVTMPKGAVSDAAWDQHDALKAGHEDNAFTVDQPIAALLKDLKSRGLLDETLVVWTGEFGRTPFAQGKDGRDHNPFGFTAWLAGGGVKAGHIYGATDDYGYRAVTDKVTMHDFHANILHALGVDHTRLTYRFGGRDMRLTDVHGEIHPGLFA